MTNEQLASMMQQAAVAQAPIIAEAVREATASAKGLLGDKPKKNETYKVIFEALTNVVEAKTKEDQGE